MADKNLGVQSTGDASERVRAYGTGGAAAAKYAAASAGAMEVAGAAAGKAEAASLAAASASQALGQAAADGAASMLAANRVAVERAGALMGLAAAARDAAAAERELSAAAGAYRSPPPQDRGAGQTRAVQPAQPGTDLLQRASQVKDTLDLTIPAARTVGAIFGSWALPLSGAAAGVGVLSAAYMGGAEESREYARTLIKTGDAAGLSAEQMQDMARRISSVAGTQSQAAQAINLLALNTAVSSDGMERAARTAVVWNQATGTAIAETVGAFGEIANAPLAATVKLNEGMNFLTASTYEQIRSLVEQGRVAQAADIAQQAYADALMDRAPKLAQQLGGLERAWTSIKSTAMGAWDAMFNLGRNETLEERINVQAAVVQNLENRYQDGMTRNRALGELPARLAAAQELLADLEKQYRANLAVKSEGATRKQETDQVATRNSYLSANIRMTDSQQRTNAIQTEEAAFRAAVGELKEGTLEYQKVYAAHETAIARINERFDKPRNTPKRMPRLAFTPSRLTSGPAPTEGDGASPSAAVVQFSAREEAKLAISDFGKARDWQAESQLRGIGLTASERALQDSMGQVLDRFKQIRGNFTDRTIHDGGQNALNSSTYAEGMFEIDRGMEAQLVRERAHAEERIAIQQNWKVGAQQAFGEWVESTATLMEQSKNVVSSAFSGMTDLVTEFVITGKAKFSDFARSILADMAKIATRQAVLGVVTSVAGLMFGGMSGAAAGTERMASGVQASGGDGVGALIYSNGWGVPNAKGGVYSSRSLSAYSNGVYDSPQFFEFAKGAGVFGEAGAEAIMPLKRGPDGILGVRADVPRWAPQPAAAAGGSEVNVITSIQVMGDGSVNETKDTGNNDSARMLGDMISSQTKAIIARELRPGGLIYNFGNRG